MVEQSVYAEVIHISIVNFSLVERLFKCYEENMRLYTKRFFPNPKFQKRGLPHVHLLLNLKHNSKISTPDACQSVHLCRNSIFDRTSEIA